LRSSRQALWRCLKPFLSFAIGCIQDHYSTTSKRSFQDPSKTLGFGGTTKAEKLKEAVRRPVFNTTSERLPDHGTPHTCVVIMAHLLGQAKSRGTAVPLMVQFETFDDAVIERWVHLHLKIPPSPRLAVHQQLETYVQQTDKQAGVWVRQAAPE
jgi:hypothetical protein